MFQNHQPICVLLAWPAWRRESRTSHELPALAASPWCKPASPQISPRMCLWLLLPPHSYAHCTLHPLQLWCEDAHKPHALPGVSSPSRSDRVERQDSGSSSQAERRPRSSERLGSGGLATAELLADASSSGKRELQFGSNGAANGNGSSKAAAAARMRPRQLLRLG